MPKPNTTLDLHGIKHADVKLIVENHVLYYSNDLPLKIITGNSVEMRKIVIGVLEEHDFRFIDGMLWNRGEITVTG